jgi:hypothetical protein
MRIKINLRPDFHNTKKKNTQLSVMDISFTKYNSNPTNHVGDMGKI